MALTYRERLTATDTLLCLGLDPVPERVEALTGRGDLAGVEAFLTRLLEVLGEPGRRPGAIKPNLAYFEQYGSGGVALLERLLRLWSARTPVILDAKRGDIGPSSRAYARAAFETWGGDAVTVSPWLGWDSVEPFLEWCPRRGVYVLLRTSNPGADLLQQGSWWELAGHLESHYQEGLGAVVGATRPGDLERVLEFAPQLALLIPGVGTQGGSAPEVRALLGDQGRHHRVNVSSAILYAGKPGEDWLEAAVTAAARYRDELSV